MRWLAARQQNISRAASLGKPFLQVAPGTIRSNRRPHLLPRRDSTSVAAALFGISGSALVARFIIHHGTIWWNSPARPRRYKGGFEPEMTRREAALILGVRESADKKVVMERCVSCTPCNPASVPSSPCLPAAQLFCPSNCCLLLCGRRCVWLRDWPLATETIC